MVSPALVKEVESLSTSDRLDLLGRIWDSLDPQPVDRELAEAQLGLAEYRSAPDSVVGWDDAMTDLRRKYAR